MEDGEFYLEDLDDKVKLDLSEAVSSMCHADSPIASILTNRVARLRNLDCSPKGLSYSSMETTLMTRRSR